MTKIVAGVARGRRLKVPQKGTRPTSARVREALFSRLEHMDILQQARVLDLYGGSGALGLEAASRGAIHVEFVERSRSVAQLIAVNASATGLSELCTVHAADVRRFLLSFPGNGSDAEEDLRHNVQGFDVIFLDPPYDISEDDLTEVLLLMKAVLVPDTLVVVERSTRSPEPIWPEHLRLEERRDYGETAIWFAGPPLPPK